MQQRLAPQKQAEPCDRESKLRQQILEYCASQWPRWLVVWARSDKKSTLPVGVADLFVFASDKRLIICELKSKTSKVSIEQSAWAYQMSALGFTVHVIRSFDEFLALVE